MCSIVAILGILTVRSSPLIRPMAISTLPQPLDQPFLSREQTDEWKGWMQFLILIYHHTGGSKILGIYKIIRLCVASYLFMTGFGHTVYFLRRGDFSLRRHAGVLLRLNLLSCVLPYIMQTDYLFYYFAPLTSFWYLILVLTLRINHSRNSSLRFLMSKILFAAILVAALIRTPGILEAVFTILKKTCNIKWDIKEWRFRVHLDSYIVFSGMIVGTGFVRFSASKQRVDMKKGTFSPVVISIFHLRLIGLTVAGSVIPVLWFIATRTHTKQDFNWWMPYTSWLPILVFATLRNSTQGLRNVHSSLFAWLGRHSLETFTLQFHIWLAADTQGLLSLGIFRNIFPGSIADWLDFTCITVAFLWTSWLVAAATNTITAWIIDPRAGRPDVEPDTDTSNGPVLPRNKSKENFTGHSQSPGQASFIVPHFVAPTSSAFHSLLGDLRVRLGLIIAILWFLNMVSHYENPMAIVLTRSRRRIDTEIMYVAVVDVFTAWWHHHHEV